MKINGITKRQLSALAVLPAALAGLQVARAAAIPIVNPSFESPAVATGVMTTSGIPGWTSTVPDTTGVFHPPSPEFQVTPTDGHQVGYIRATGDNSDRTIHQDLGAMVTAGMTYTLKVDFLASRYANPLIPGDCGIDLEAQGPGGGVRLGFDEDATGSFRTLTVTFAAVPGSLITGHLQIAIFCFDNVVPSDVALRFFDNVRLDASPAPMFTVLHGSFGMIGLIPSETARLNAFCDGSVRPAACDVTFAFHDTQGRLLKQTVLTLPPGTSSFVDLPAPPGGTVAPLQIVPSFMVSRGTALMSLELFDTITDRTQLLIDWGDGARPRTGDADFGPAGLTYMDTARLGAFCEGDGSVMPQSCDITFSFFDMNGRTLKQARMTLAPGTSEFLDLKLSDTTSTARRLEIEPCFTVERGTAVGSVAIVDGLTGMTLTHAYPGRLESAR